MWLDAELVTLIICVHIINSFRIFGYEMSVDRYGHKLHLLVENKMGQMWHNGVEPVLVHLKFYPCLFNLFNFAIQDSLGMGIIYFPMKAF